MTGRELLDKFNTLCPFRFAAEWDNAGFLVGNPDRQVHRVLLALDATGKIIDQAIEEGVDMIVAHHPLLFRPAKNIRFDDQPGERLMKLIAHDISFIALHTNFDICVMADLAADKIGITDTKVLEVTGEEAGKTYGFGRYGMLPDAMTLKELAKRTKERLGIDYVTVSGEMDAMVRKVAISTGSGKSGLDACRENSVSVLITGDVDHHTALDALEMGVFMIDAGHFGTEKMFAPYMADYFKREIVQVEAFIGNMQTPFKVI